MLAGVDVDCCATRGRQARKICGLRLFHAAPWPTRSQKPGEAGSTACGEISEGIWLVSWWRRFGQQACRAAERDWTSRKLEAKPTSPRSLLVPCSSFAACPPAVCSAMMMLHPPCRGGTSTCSGNAEICAMVETGCCIVRATSSAMRVG
jgi:hypothetical protein